MKKIILRSMVVLSSAMLLLPMQSVEACTGFIIGKNLTSDGSTIFGRTEDLEPNHNKNFVVRERKNNKSGSTFTDEANGFTFTLPEVSYKYTAVPDVTPEQGIFDEAGFNEFGVSITATVSATANDAIQKVDPYVKNGIAESGLTTVVLPHAKTAKEGIQLLAKIVEDQGAAEGNIVVLADKSGVWYMEILSGHQYVAIKFPDDKFAVFPNTFFLGNVDFDDTENTIASKDVIKVAKDANTYTEVNGAFHVARSYDPPLADADRSRVWSGIKSLNPNENVNFDDESFELFHTTTEKLTLRDAMNLQRNRLEGTKYKPQDQMALDGKGIPKGKKTVDKVYKYPISNPNVMEAHIFQLKDNLPNSVGGGVFWLSMGSPKNAPYLPYYGNINNTYKAYQETSLEYNKDSWYWTVSRINDIVAKYPDLFPNNEIRSKFEKLESEWMSEENLSDEEQISLENNPELASVKATETSIDRADKVFKQLQDIQKDSEDRVVEKYGEDALKNLDKQGSSDTEKKVEVEKFDYDFVIAIVIFLATIIGVVTYLFKRINSKKEVK